MLYTLTTNPAIDMNICTRGLEAKKVNRAFDAVYTPNGKGLNVSFVLGHFGVSSKILGFFGGFSGKYIVEESRKMGYEVKPVWVDDTTRINIFLNDGESEYKLVSEGSIVTEEAQAELLEIIKASDDMEYLSISGSLSPGISTEYYDKIFSICQEKKTEVILDISSPKMAELLKYRPLLIKPNDEELRDIFGITVKTEEEILAALEELHRKGARNILFTLGEKGSYFSDGRVVYYAGTQPVKLLSSACAGDAALAAFMSIWLDDFTKIEDALKRSAATGANVAESNALGTMEKVEEYMQNIQVRRVK